MTKSMLTDYIYGEIGNTDIVNVSTLAYFHVTWRRIIFPIIA